MDSQQRHRTNQVLQLALLAAVLGLILLSAVRFFGNGIPCPFYKITGFRCPACGMTRAVLALVSGNVKEALGYHLLVLPALALVLLLCVTQAMKYISAGVCFLKPWERRFYLGVIVAFLCWMILRNIWSI